MRASHPVYHCPVEVRLDKIDGKWRPLVLWHLHTQTRRFGELIRLIPTVTEKMLTETLRRLEPDGIYTGKSIAKSRLKWNTLRCQRQLIDRRARCSSSDYCHSLSRRLQLGQKVGCFRSTSSTEWDEDMTHS